MKENKPTKELLLKRLNKLKKEVEWDSEMIKTRTNDWIKHQKELIDIQETLDQLNIKY